MILFSFFVSDVLDSNALKIIFSAIHEIEQKTCIRFPKYDETFDEDYLEMDGINSGCWSFIGRLNGRQPINIGPGCVYHYTVIHELVHAIGFWHQQSTWNRDEYIKILWENIINGTEGNFQKVSLDVVSNFNTTYDYNSVMHYSLYAFSKNGKPTIAILDANATYDESRQFTNTDVTKIQRMYAKECAKRYKIAQN